jgi:hypothetical protein
MLQLEHSQFLCQELLQHMFGEHCLAAFIRLTTTQLTAHGHQRLLCSALVQDYQWLAKAFYNEHEQKSHRVLAKLR